MQHDESHLSAEQLLLASDGEASADSAAHLKECETCRTRLREVEQTAAEAALLHQRRFDPWIPAGAAARALLQSRLAGPPGTRSAVWNYAAVSAAAILIAAAIVTFYGIPGGGRRAVPVSFPEPSLTPGAVVATSAEQVCRTSRPKNRIVPASLQRKVFEEYGIPAAEPRSYEVDYLITPALGGSDDIRNLWPQSNSAAVWNARIKDALEDRLHDLVCGGSLDLATAQHDLAADWIAAYRKYFHTDTPLEEAR